MDFFQLAGFSASVCIGVCLGLIGGGGSILTLPILVYLLHINPVVSSAYSLFVVGTTSLVGALSAMNRKQVAYRVALLFAVPSFLAVYLTRQYLLPAIPDTVVLTNDLTVSREKVIMVLFGLLMLAAAVSMIRNSRTKTSPENINPESGPKAGFLLIVAEGAIIGLLTGLVGAGGGFLIIPALVLLARLPMKIAVGTSLLIIAVKSLFGFVGDLSHVTIDWAFLLPFTGLSISGLFLGTYLSRFFSGFRLKKTFGYFVLLISLYILVREAV